MISYVVLVKVGPYEFGKRFDKEQEALTCFDSITSDPNGEIVNGHLIMPSNALVDRVEIQIHNDQDIPKGPIGTPNR